MTKLLNFLRKGEKVQITHVLKRLRVRGLVIFRQGIRTLNIRSTLQEPFDFILSFLCYKLTCFLFERRNLRIVIKRKETFFIYIFLLIWKD